MICNFNGFFSLQAMLSQLRAIFDLIIQFQTTQENMYAAAVAELEARQDLEKKAEKKTADVSSFSYYKTKLFSIFSEFSLVL